MPKCRSPPSSPSPQPCAKFLDTLVSRPGRRALPRRADRRCGRPSRPRQRRTTIHDGIDPPNYYRRANSISVWPGDQFLVARAEPACVACVGGAPRRPGWAGGGHQRPAITLRYARQEGSFGCAPMTTRDDAP